NIVPTLPAALEPLREVSFNVWWTWEPSARRLFRHLDPELWNRTNHNPIRMLQLSRQARLEELATDKTFLRELKQVYDAFQKYLTRKDTYGKNGVGAVLQKPVAYFSAEFGFHESIPNYSGGLGILSGDHCKSASDLDLNFVAIGLLYRHRYSGEQRGRSTHHRRALRWRPRNANATGDRARYWRRQRLERARDRAGRFPHERRPLRLSRPRADSAARRGEEARFLRRPSGRSFRQRFHHPHAGAGGQRFFPARNDAQIFWQLRHRDRSALRRIFLFRPNPDQRHRSV